MLFSSLHYVSLLREWVGNVKDWKKTQIQQLNYRDSVNVMIFFSSFLVRELKTASEELKSLYMVYKTTFTNGWYFRFYMKCFRFPQKWFVAFYMLFFRYLSVPLPLFPTYKNHSYKQKAKKSYTHTQTHALAFIFICIELTIARTLLHRQS